MSTTDDRADKALPVTGEVGSEGGSFADPTYQVATFENRLPRYGGGASSTANAPDPNGGMIRYPTEPPLPPDATEGMRLQRFNWRAGVIGAAAGFAGASLALGLYRRRARGHGRT